LPRGRPPPRLLINMPRDNFIADRPARPLAAASILVGAVALLGFDVMNSGGPNRSHKTSASIVHAIAPANSAAIAIPTALAGSAGVLALVLWLGRHGGDVLRLLVPIEPRIAPTPSNVSPNLQSRISITYHTGGLYGP
jgi:hypothetical protein